MISCHLCPSVTSSQVILQSLEVGLQEKNIKPAIGILNLHAFCSFYYNCSLNFFKTVLLKHAQHVLSVWFTNYRLW